MKVKTLYKLTITACTAAMFASSANAAVTFSPTNPYNPNTFFSSGFYAGNESAGFDFNGAGGPNQPGFTGISPAGTGTTNYNAVSNGITMDMNITGATNTAHRNRGNAGLGNLVRDFGQWFNNTTADAEIAFSFTGLELNTHYNISFFVYNAGSGQMRHNFYEGTSSADPFITQFTTASAPGNPAWTPGVTFSFNSGATGQLDITMQEAGSRLNMDGISIVATPEPTSIALLGLGGLALILRRSKVN